jgi:hypothetical protein
MVNRAPRRAAAGSLLLFGLTASGIIATVLSVDRVRAEVRERDRQAAALVEERLSAGLRATVSSLSGVDGLAADGDVTAEEFAAFTADLLPASLYTALAFAEPVPRAQRAAWEAETGVTVIDTDGAGGFVPAADRPTHAIVRLVAPSTEASRRVIGFDLLSDDVRGRAVDDALSVSSPVVHGPVRLAASGSTGLFVAKSVRDPDGAAVGVVGSGIGATSLLDLLDGLDVQPVSILIDGEVLVESESSGVEASFEVGGRTFLIRTGSPDTGNWLLPVVLAVGTAILAVAAVFAVRREAAERRRERWIANRNVGLALLAERLAAAPTSDAVLSVVLRDAGTLVDAEFTNVGRRDPVDPTKLVVIHDRAMPDDLASEFGIQPIDAPLPLTDCARNVEMIVVPDLRAYEERYPHALAHVRRAGIQAVVCVPLSLGTEAATGAVGFAWTHRLPSERQRDVAGTAQLIGQMIGRALERANVREVVQQRVDELGALARSLGVARTTPEINQIVTERLPALLDVKSAELAPEPLIGVPSTRSYPPQTSGGGHLNLVLRDGAAWDLTTEALTQAVLDFIEGAWTRAKLYDHEFSVLRRLQASLLSEAPRVDGLEIAVAYRSAVEAVGIGGDWYSVIEHGDTIDAVIGDVAGHGPGAVAIMAEVKTIIRHLLSAGAAIEDVIEHADVALRRRQAYASAVIVRIDMRADRLFYVTAGHPYPVVVGERSGSVLDVTHRPWLGVPAPPCRATEAPFPPGSTVVLYTDGLIEDRGVPIDRSIHDLVNRISASEAPPTALVDALLDHRDSTRSSITVDDDIALVVIRRPR